MLNKDILRVKEANDLVRITRERSGKDSYFEELTGQLQALSCPGTYAQSCSDGLACGQLHGKLVRTVSGGGSGVDEGVVQVEDEEFGMGGESLQKFGLHRRHSSSQD